VLLRKSCTHDASRHGIRLLGHVLFRKKRRSTGISPVAIFGLSLLFVFLILAALYESWSLPISVLHEHARRGLWHVRGALSAQTARPPPSFRQSWSQVEEYVYAQIGLIMIIGARGQERDLDRRICQGGVREWCNRCRCCSRRRQTSPSPDFDDLARFHCRLSAACLGLRFRSGCPASAWHRSDRRMLAASGVAIFLVPAGFCIVERASGLIGRVTGRFRNRSSRVASQGHD